MDRFVDFTKDHNLDLSIVLFPLKPDTVTEAGLNKTILPFTRAIEAYGQDKAVRIIDMTLGLLVDEDFMLDLDHVNFEGNIKWTTHALNNELAFLIDHLPSGELE